MKVILPYNVSKESFLKNPSMNYGSSKSAKIVLSKSIFNVKNQLIFFKRNLGLGQIYWPKDQVAKTYAD